jgi:putative (di)nucleoside polyphosphate hydrolase
MEKEYRKCVGMMILNKENKILVGRRIDHPSGYWQMPQGGIDNKENPEEAVWREMMEEIGTNNAELIMISSHWYSYIIPEETLKTLPWGNEFKGQKQKWFAFRFKGNDKEINVTTENPEFSEWKWIHYSNLAANIVPFKKELYKKVIEEFKKNFSK